MTNMHRIRNGFLMLLICYSVFNSGCNTRENGSGQTHQKTAAKAHIVLIQQMKFDPAVLTVSAGDTVTWINKDIFDHNVTEQEKNLWMSDVLSPGKTWSKVVKQNATYYCVLHPVMKGSLVIE
jgi:plastocyanin